jgi:hypothetical protein
MMSRRAFLWWQTLNAALVALVLVLTGGCQAPPFRESTTVTFTFETWDTKSRLQGGYEVEVTVNVPGFAPLSVSGKTSFSYSVPSAKYPAAAKQIDVEATVQAPPSTLLTCTWTAVTSTGTRSSERSRGGEGSAAVPVGGTSATTTCQYQA